MATNKKFITYTPQYNKKQANRISPNLSKLKSYEELMQENQARLEEDRQIKEYLSNLQKYQTYLEEEEKYKSQLAEQQAKEMEIEKAKENTNVFGRTGQTLGDFFSRIGAGGASAFDKIKSGAATVSKWGGEILYDLDQAIKGNAPLSNVWKDNSDRMKYGANILAENTNTPLQQNLPGSEVFNWFEKGEELKRLEENLKSYAERQQASYIKDMSPKGQQIVYGVAEGIGEMLPSIAVTVASGGAAGAGLAVTGAKAFGGASEQALEEGASLGDAVAYGMLNAGVEIATEKLVGTATDKFTGAGKGILDGAIKKVATNKLVKVGLDVVGEGAEEAIAEFLDPIMKQITYDDKAMEHFLTKEHGEEILTSAIIGGLTSLVMEGANVVISKSRNADSAEILSKYEDIVQMEQALQQEGKLTQEQAQEFARIKQELEAQMQLKLNKMSPHQQIKMLNQFSNTQMFKNYNPLEVGSKVTNTVVQEQSISQNQTQVKEQDVKVDFDQETEIENAKNLHETFKKINSNVANLTFDNTLGKDVNGYYNRRTNQIVINPNVENQYTTVLTHELTHSLEKTNTYNELQRYALGYLKKTNEYNTLRNELEALYRQKGLLDGMNEQEIDNYIDQEIMAKFSERLFNNQDSINQIVNEKRSLARKILDWVKEKLSLLTGKLSKQDLALKKELQRIEKLYTKALGELEAQNISKTDIRDSYDNKIKNKHKKFSLNEETNDIFEKNNIKGFEKKTIIDKIYDDALENLRDGETEYSNTITVFNNEIDYTMQYVENFDEDGELIDYDYNLTINNLKKYDVENLLKDHNIEFETSKQSESIYFKLNGEEYRVSTHKRPPIVDGVTSYEHSYQNEIIGKDQIDMYKKVQNLLKQNDKKFSLNKDYNINNKVASFSEQRLKAIEKESIARHMENYANVYVAKISPQEFLDLTADENLQKELRNETKPLDTDKLADEEQHIFLTVNMKTGQVMGHEGRHRMIALQNVGVSNVDIAIYPYYNTHDKSRTEKRTNFSLLPSDSRWEGIGIKGTSLNEVIPYSVKYENEIKSKFGQEDADIRYSVRHSQNKQTIINATESYANQELQDMMKTDSLIYEVSKNKDTVEKARQEIKGKNVEEEIGKTLTSLEKTFKATKDNEVLVAKAMLLLQEANKKGLNMQANDLATSVSAVLTQMGKTTQAGSIIQRLSPEGGLVAFRKMVELENANIMSKKGEYTSRKRFRVIAKEREQQWFNQDLRYVKNRAVDTFLKNNQDIKLSNEQITRLKKLTTNSENYTSNVIKVFEQVLPNDLTRANQLGSQFAKEVLNQEKVLRDIYTNNPVVIPEILVDQLLNAKSEASAKEVANKIQKVIGSQKTSTTFEKAMQWRYLAMLANPKTHIRNEIGNRAMGLVVDTRNTLSRLLQSTFIRNPELRTRTFKKASATTVLFVEEHANQVYKEFEDLKNSKFAEADKDKRIFTNKFLEKIRELNFNLLESADERISKARFVKELSEWITAKGYTVNQLKNDTSLLQQGTEFAYLEALKATFQDSNAFATLMNNMKAKSKVFELSVGAFMPFTKTPSNIARRGFEYSPAGLIKNLTYDIHQLRNGNITINQYLDKLAEGLTGSMITIVGLFLAKLGILSGGDDENIKVSNYERAIGEQSFSIKIGDKRYTLDWMAPASIPLFTGVAIYEDLINKDADDEVIWSVAGAISAGLDPMTEMSFLQSFNNILASYDNNNLQGMVLSGLESFASQFVPTVSSQIAKVVDEVRRTTTTTGKSSYKKDFNRRSNYMISRIPFLSKQLEPYVNVWGEIENNANFTDRLLENTAYPFWISKNKPSDVDKEIMRLYKKNGNTEVLPGIPNSYYTKDGTRVDMTNEEYTEFKIKVGTFSKKQLQEIFASQFYQNLDDENKEKIIKKVYDNAREFAKSNNSKEHLVYQALSINNNQDKLVKYMVELNAIEGIKDKDGNTIQGSKKNNIILYIESQKLNKEQKYLLLGLAGYKNSNTKKADIIKFINSIESLNEEQKQLLLELYF